MEQYADNEVMYPSTPNHSKDEQPEKLLSYNDIAIKLLNEKLILTALELHAELCEAGRESPILKDFFANPNNFENTGVKPEPTVSIPRSSSQATLDSLDMTRYSEDGGGMDERVAVLEFELRKAKDNISALRANLTIILESESTCSDKNTDKQLAEEHPIKPHELRAINFMVYEYLLAQSYKLTSITFSDENEDQDFEDWEDVGLNITKRPNLLQIYREFFRKIEYDKSSCRDVPVQTEAENIVNPSKDDQSQVEYLKQRIVLLEQEKFHLEQRYEKIDGLKMKDVIDDHSSESSYKNQIHSTAISTSTTPDKFEIVESLQGTSQDTDQDESSTSVVLSISDSDAADKDWMKIKLPEINRAIIKTPALEQTINLDQSLRLLPELFKQNILLHTQINTDPDIKVDMAPESSIQLVETQDALIQLLAKSLPIIVPNIILNKRGEIIPLLLNTIRLNSEARQRNELFELLFNLKKKPQHDERRMLLGALVTAVTTAISPLEPEDILTICWEQSQHRYTERRLLAVECCSTLAPYTSNDTRNSLVISMLQQMLLDDKDSTVRVSVVRSLTLLVTLADDPDKYFQCEELAMAALDDISHNVSDMAATILLPTLAQWALSLNRLLTHLLARVISKLKVSLQHTPVNKDNNNNGERAITLINVLKILLPHMIVCIVNNPTVKSMITENTSTELPQHFLSLSQSNLTDARIFNDDPQNIGKMLNTFSEINEFGENEIWTELDWFNTKLLPDILEITKTVDISQEQVLNAFLLYLQSFTNGIGNQVLQTKIKRIFEFQVMELEKQLTDQTSNNINQTTISLALIPAYLLILSTLDDTQFVNTLKHFVIIYSINSINIDSLVLPIRLLCSQSCANLIDQILNAMWNGVVHQKAIVRSTTAQLFGKIVGNIDEQLVTSRIAPAIITLANDSDIMVKANAVIALGKLITNCTSMQVQDKGRLTIEAIVKESHGVSQALTIPLISTLAAIASNCPQHYVEDIIVTQLTGITASALQQAPNINLASALLDAYSTLIYCSLSDNSVTGVLLPGLKYLETLINHVLPHQKENVLLLIREAQLRQNGSKSIEYR